MPDSDGDVGSNHYVQSVNRSIMIFDKNGNYLSGPTSVRFILCRVDGHSLLLQ